jgi:hypothetical protein
MFAKAILSAVGDDRVRIIEYSVGCEVLLGCDTSVVGALSPFAPSQENVAAPRNRIQAKTFDRGQSPRFSRCCIYARSHRYELIHDHWLTSVATTRVLTGTNYDSLEPLRAVFATFSVYASKAGRICRAGAGTFGDARREPHRYCASVV